MSIASNFFNDFQKAINPDGAVVDKDRYYCVLARAQTEAVCIFERKPKGKQIFWFGDKSSLKVVNESYEPKKVAVTVLRETGATMAEDFVKAGLPEGFSIEKLNRNKIKIPNCSWHWQTSEEGDIAFEFRDSSKAVLRRFGGLTLWEV